MDWAGLVAGLVVIVATLTSIAGTLVIPRAVQARLTSSVGRSVGRVLRFVARRLKGYHAKDRVLALDGPMWLLSLLSVWMFALFVGWALVLAPFVSGSFGEALREAGSSLLTLGFESSDVGPATVIDLLAAATGLAVIAMLIAYLPVVYSAFSRRETLVTMLESRAGLPAWGPELLWRHQRAGIMDSLPDLFAGWEEWAADVEETHASYPVLVHFRSPHPLRSWITGLLAVMDAAALYQSLSPSTAPSQARLCLRMGFTCLRAVADALREPYEPDPSPDDPIELPYEEFEQAVEMLRDIGFPIERSAAEAWPDFCGWRVNYEALAYAIADRVVAPPARWSGPRRELPGLVIHTLRPVDRRPGGAISKHTPER